MSCLRDEILQDPSKGVRRLVSEFGDRLFNFAFGLCANASDAEDLVFRTLEQAVQKIDQYDPSCAMLPWLRTILLNYHRTDLRRKGMNALMLMDELPDIADDAPGPDEICLRRVDSDVVLAAVRTLPETLRVVVLLRYCEDLPLDEIGRILDVPGGTVKSRLHAAKQMLRKSLSRYFEERGRGND